VHYAKRHAIGLVRTDGSVMENTIPELEEPCFGEHPHYKFPLPGTAAWKMEMGTNLPDLCEAFGYLPIIFIPNQSLNVCLTNRAIEINHVVSSPSQIS
jgi:hypothetical protein